MTPLQIGITGGIGSGKSIICKVFRHLGVPTYDADTRAKYLMNTQEALKSANQENFGEESYQNGQLNRKYLASKVFNDSQQVTLLNQLVHPKVAEDYATWVVGHAGVPYVIKEAALLIETGSYKHLRALITVSASEKIRMQRIKARDPHRSEKEIKAIMQKQLSNEERQKVADYTIDNAGTLLIIPQVLQLHHTFLQ
ncbi:MAG: dephospho-CoA kinase [Thermonemataceae bacterium]